MIGPTLLRGFPLASSLCPSEEEVQEGSDPTVYFQHFLPSLEPPFNKPTALVRVTLKTNFCVCAAAPSVFGVAAPPAVAPPSAGPVEGVSRFVIHAFRLPTEFPADVVAQTTEMPGTLHRQHST